MKFNATEQMINILLEDSIINNAVNGEIRPVVARYGAAVPYVVVSNENTEVRRSKMGAVVGTTSDVLLTIVTDSYEELRIIVDRITAIEGRLFKEVSYKEDYGDEKYVALINVNIEL